MAKRTAIIDIGSNSARLVVFEKTSHYGFHLICEQKSKVRIGEEAYDKNGLLQPKALSRAFLTLQSFSQTIQKYQASKTICVATSALRDAPNGDIFVKWIKKELGLSIKVIDGNKEASYGALAAKNLLPKADAISVDIGGGSSDIALIKNDKIIDTYSLNLGTVRLKELFSDKNMSQKEIMKKAKKYIDQELKMLPENFKEELVIGMGGTARGLSKAIMKRSAHPLYKIHAFRYNIASHSDFLNAVPTSSLKELKSLGLKKNRFDTIREGTLIFNEILSKVKAKEVITSGVGVREGVYLEHALKHENFKYPKDINPSITSILDRFKPYVTVERRKKNTLYIAKALYTTLQAEMKDNCFYLSEIKWALKLSSIGNTLNIYKSHQTAFFIAMQELNYGFTHEEMLLISMLLRMHGKSLIHETLFETYESLLPSRRTLVWLSFIYSLTLFIAEASNDAKITFKYKKKVLTIKSDKPLYLAKENIEILEKPMEFTVVIDDEEKLPKNKDLGIS
ncbi:Exopolyphosphatase [hydrothermal vent metagenome]|uniref:Exopolyphosphatase n=1 Tax=hydrothermal vent metagenome TaxID=652676 RepID=A0A1W1EEB7_9ZZZZ